MNWIISFFLTLDLFETNKTTRLNLGEKSKFYVHAREILIRKLVTANQYGNDHSMIKIAKIKIRFL
jgi:hypothetical protein